MSAAAKIISLLWASNANRLFDALLNDIAPQLLAMQGISAVQMNLDDTAVAMAAAKKIQNQWPLCQALCSFVSESEQSSSMAIGLLQSAGEKMSYFNVDFTEPLPARVVVSGQRSPGFSQIAFIARAPQLSHGDWLNYWRNQHTAIAIETQSTWRYVQNCLHAGEGSFDAIVEECFPAAAMTDDQAFYDAVGDEDLCRSRQHKMLESCSRFIDFSRIAVLPTSEYRF